MLIHPNPLELKGLTGFSCFQIRNKKPPQWGLFRCCFPAGLLADRTKASRRPAGRPAGRKPCPAKVCGVPAGPAGLLVFDSTLSINCTYQNMRSEKYAYVRPAGQQ